MLLQSGWTDDLFPPSQSLRIYNAVRALKGYAALQFGDLGHSRGSNKENTDHAFQEQGAGFFGARLQHAGKAPGQRQRHRLHPDLPAERARRRPVHARTGSKLHPHTVTFGSAAAQLFTSAGGNADHRRRIRPDRRHHRRVQGSQSRNRAEHRQLHDDEPRVHAVGAAHRDRYGEDHRSVRRARLAPVGRAAQRRTAADQPRRLPTRTKTRKARSPSSCTATATSSLPATP